MGKSTYARAGLLVNTTPRKLMGWASGGGIAIRRPAVARQLTKAWARSVFLESDKTAISATKIAAAISGPDGIDLLAVMMMTQVRGMMMEATICCEVARKNVDFMVASIYFASFNQG